MKHIQRKCYLLMMVLGYGRKFFRIDEIETESTPHLLLARWVSFLQNSSSNNRMNAEYNMIVVNVSSSMLVVQI